MTRILTDTVAVVYATWNRGDLLRKSLERLGGLTLPDEVVVVDDGSVDDTERVCSEAAKYLPIKYVYNHRPYEALCSQAKNVGVKSTSADLLIFSEPECMFDTDVVAQMRETHEADPERVINAGVVNHLGPDGAVRDTTRNWQAYWVATFKREWLESVGGWDEEFPATWGVDDIDLGTRLRYSGHGQYNDMEIVVSHQWHPSGSMNQGPNWEHFNNKGFVGQDGPVRVIEHPLVVANKNHEWGVPIAR